MILKTLRKIELRKRNIILNIIGISLIIISLLRIFTVINYITPIHIFWMCNHIPLIIGISILFRSSFLLTAETSLLFAGDLIWCADFLTKLIFNKYITGSTINIFTDYSITSAISIISHLCIIPLAILAIILIKKSEPKAWKGSLIHMIILIPASIYFGKFYNLNCFLQPCSQWILNFNLYPIIAFIIYLFIFVIPINKILAKL